MRVDQVINWGITDPQGRILWSQVQHMTHNQLLKMMWEERLLAKGYFTGSRHGHEGLRLLCLRRASLLETFAWRVYMFGSEPIGLHPGRMGELRKRQRNDPHYWKYLSEANIRHGTVGCENLSNLYRKRGVRCAKQGCTHNGQKYADKFLKSLMRREWETKILPIYK